MILLLNFISDYIKQCTNNQNNGIKSYYHIYYLCATAMYNNLIQLQNEFHYLDLAIFPPT